MLHVESVVVWTMIPRRITCENKMLKLKGPSKISDRTWKRQANFFKFVFIGSRMRVGWHSPFNGSYGFVISSCCFRRPLGWAKFWYCSVLNGPHIQWTPCIKRTIAQYVLGEIHLVADRLEGLEWFAFHNLKVTFPSVYCFYSSYFKSYSTVFLSDVSSI